MTIFEISNIYDPVTLLSSNIELLNDKTVLIFLHFDVALLKLKSTNLISISEDHIEFYIDKQNIILDIKAGSKTAINELKIIFDKALNYESTHIEKLLS
jgi:hypothetical protein